MLKLLMLAKSSLQPLYKMDSNIFVRIANSRINDILNYMDKHFAKEQIVHYTKLSVEEIEKL